ncbi:MAG: hypothetical protein JXN59_15565, partial [Anaerolineae bacterium]|nr:hypothetical protein [Anaerolineae bacterium]
FRCAGQPAGCPYESGAVFAFALFAGRYAATALLLLRRFFSPLDSDLLPLPSLAAVLLCRSALYC